MSFEEQERALFDLLFDNNLRKDFYDDPGTALSGYELDDDEYHDFTIIRPDALKLDADLRADLVLSHLCRSYPLMFSILSSLDEGLEILRELIDVQTMRTPPVERPTVFANRLRERFNTYDFDSGNERVIVTAILEVELGMAWTAATLKREVMANGLPPEDRSPVMNDWHDKSVRVASYVCAGIIPQPYQQLKNSLCNCADAELWRHLNRKPVARAQRKKILQQEDPRLLLARACLNRMSYCEPVVEHQTAELSDGFASLLQHVNGSNSTNQILAQFKQAGATDQILKSVHSAFRQLLDAGMLELVRN